MKHPHGVRGELVAMLVKFPREDVRRDDETDGESSAKGLTRASSSRPFAKWRYIMALDQCKER